MQLKKAYEFWKEDKLYSVFDIYKWFMVYEVEIDECLEFQKQNKISIFYEVPKMDEIKIDIATAYRTLKDFTKEYKVFESRAKLVLDEFYVIEKSKVDILNYLKKHISFVYIDVAVFFLHYSGLDIGDVPDKDRYLELVVSGLNVRVKFNNSCCPYMIRLLQIFSDLIQNKSLEPDLTVIISDFLSE